MPLYKYKGYDPRGGEAVGTVQADGPHDAALKVKALGLYPRKLERLAYGKKGRLSALLPQREGGHLPSATRQLAVLLHSGVPLVEALRALSEEKGGRLRGILVGIREQVASGSSLARSLEGHPGLFPEFYRNMVAAGEQSGNLDTVLMRLADYLEFQDSVREKVRTALMYPVFMAAVSVLVLGFLFTFVVPKIVTIFEDTQSALPFLTVALIAISNLFVHYWWALLLGAALAALGIRRFFRSHKSRADRLLFRPLESLYLTRFARTLGFLLEGGLPVLRAMELAGKASGNAWLSERSRVAALKVKEGGRLSASLAGLPPVLLELIATGERSGQLAAVLEQAGKSYETEFDRRIQRGLALLEPAMILTMGVVVGLIVFAVLLPMFQLNQIIK
ncbi:MAG: type II secretion system F family protein [Nitrospirota bacterium]|jgi:general secretion pathway protein F